MLVNGIAGPVIDIESIAVSLNQLALLYVYEGNLPDAMSLSELQIRFWKNYSHQHRDAKVLSCAVQPSVNTLRLGRLGADAPSAAFAYRELAPGNRSKSGSLGRQYDIHFSIEELCELSGRVDEANEALDGIYWTEYPAALLRLGLRDELLQLLKLGLRNPCSSYVRACLLELLLWHHVQIGKVSAALQLLDQSTAFEMRDYALAFRTMELIFRAEIRAEKDEMKVSGICLEIGALLGGQVDGRILNLALGIARCLGRIGMLEREAELLVEVSKAADRLNDEAISFETLHRLCELNAHDPAALMHRFRDSRYAFIRNVLGLQPRLASSARLIGALEELAALDFSTCTERLRSLEEATAH